MLGITTNQNNPEFDRRPEKDAIYEYGVYRKQTISTAARLLANNVTITDAQAAHVPAEVSEVVPQNDVEELLRRSERIIAQQGDNNSFLSSIDTESIAKVESAAQEIINHPTADDARKLLRDIHGDN